MRTTIVVDEVGRLVLPKAIREAIGVSGRAALQAEVVNGTVQIGLPEAAGSLQRRGKRRVHTGTLPEDWDSGEAVLKARARRLRR
jgi:bifunctional DNA-binding transcriptional regulator/antitoxin component of YhaV-PrlF toxin-antitoxin module